MPAAGGPLLDTRLLAKARRPGLPSGHGLDALITRSV